MAARTFSEFTITMSASQPISSTTPADVLKQIEKDVQKNEKSEQKAVKHAMKDLAHLEKEVTKSSKVFAMLVPAARATDRPLVDFG